MKIVQKIHNIYLPQINQLVLNCRYCDLGIKENNLRYLGQSLGIVQNLLKLNLDVSNNNLGENYQNMKNFGKHILKKLNIIENLQINLKGNGLGNDQRNMEYFGKSFIYLSSLKYLSVEISQNNLGQNGKNLKCLGEGVKKLVNLEYFNLYLNKNDLGIYQKQFNMGHLRDILWNLPVQNLKGLSLDLSQNNNLCQHFMDQIILNESILRLVNLEQLELSLSYISIGRDSLLYQGFRLILKELQKLKKLKLDLSHNLVQFEKGKQDERLKYFRDSFEYLGNLNELNLDFSFNRNLGEENNKGNEFLGFLKQSITKQKLQSLERLVMNLIYCGFEDEDIKELQQVIEKDMPQLKKIFILPQLIL